MAQINYEEDFPFLTGISYCEEEYIGIVVNHDNAILSFYDLGKLPSVEEQRAFLELGETWWWQSNRQLPIDVFLHIEMQEFYPILTTFSMKNVEVMFGPMTSLQNLLKKRIKRRGIQLVRKVD